MTDEKLINDLIVDMDMIFINKKVMLKLQTLIGTFEAGSIASKMSNLTNMERTNALKSFETPKYHPNTKNLVTKTRLSKQLGLLFYVEVWSSIPGRNGERFFENYLLRQTKFSKMYAKLYKKYIEEKLFRFKSVLCICHYHPQSPDRRMRQCVYLFPEIPYGTNGLKWLYTIITRARKHIFSFE